MALRARHGAMILPVRRLHPDPSEDVTIEDVYASPLAAPADRPWVGLSMVSSIDGSTVVDGDSGGLSSQNDAAVLHRLRALADVIIVGASTVRGEGYGPPSKPGQRIGVVTASGALDLTTPLFRSGAGFVITNGDADFHTPSGVEVLRAGSVAVDLCAAVERLPEVCSATRFVQAEGGAALNGALLDADLIDEINVTTSPLAVGGDGPRLASGAADHVQRYELAQLVVDEQSFVFTRWRRRGR
jgi:riboflavin biosynthesis pyrimidine reductase